MTLLWATLLLACGPSPEDVAAQLASENPAVREDTARRARNFNSPVVIEGLIRALDDPSEQVRLNAIASLIALDARDAVPKLASMITADPSPDVRREAIDALGRMPDPRGVDPIVSLLEETADTRPPLNAIWAAGQLGDMKALPVLTRLRESSDPYVSYNANQALRRIRPATGG
ncbi:MAG: HEAT repeat domain-containing protein [Deltaproteobacteria bacterium]|nr:MAG: HEAT repeat domain-containing protein [Deltaproteobacteria bacterium]